MEYEVECNFCGVKFLISSNKTGYAERVCPSCGKVVAIEIPASEEPEGADGGDVPSEKSKGGPDVARKEKQPVPVELAPMEVPGMASTPKADRQSFSKFCGKCGTALRENYKFCPKCGRRTDS